ncbi:hypothetical protein DSLASN_20360 [Desulfoluna limicola]|uniref:DUF1232 domain-containing protein n=1 Tax=Desulfoluna limicola TaxID=2810562 RepID=A0ABM7PGS7_9BACT|nr:YkvA family protein [Desulfoluna limicola]BCS96404.1 hypothetical protein DSLASN_20360 [Desulfoluna limicola]
MDKEKLLSYSEHYNEQSFGRKVEALPGGARKKVLQKAATLYAIMTEPAVPAWVKASIVGALGYFVCPLDLVPDVLPGVGFIDDVALMGLLIVEIGAYVTSSVQQRAEAFREQWNTRDIINPDCSSLPPSLLSTPSP